MNKRIRNPTLQQKSGRVMAGDRLLGDVSRGDLATISENVVVTDPLAAYNEGIARFAEFMGFHRNLQFIGVLKNPEDFDAFLEACSISYPMFQRYNPIGARGTLPHFWKSLPAKYLVAAGQFYVENRVLSKPVVERMAIDEDGNPFRESVTLDVPHKGDLVVTHISVRPQWKHAGLGRIILREVAQVKHKRLILEDLTKEGMRLAKMFDRDYEVVYHWGKRKAGGLESKHAEVYPIRGP